MLKAKDTAASVLPKKGLQKSFLGDLQFINVPEFLIGGGLNHMQWRHQKFSKQEVFVGQRYRRVEDLKSLPVGR